jgi:predicted DNA-binding transcriptional regulator AlpA
MTVGKSPKPAKPCQKRSATKTILAPPAIDLSGRVSISLREVSQVCGVSERTAWEWYRQGLLKGVKHGQILRFDLEHVRSLFQPQDDSQS